MRSAHTLTKALLALAMKDTLTKALFALAKKDTMAVEYIAQVSRFASLLLTIILSERLC